MSDRVLAAALLRVTQKLLDAEAEVARLREDYARCSDANALRSEYNDELVAEVARLRAAIEAHRYGVGACSPHPYDRLLWATLEKKEVKP